jgi:hypothetical protein
MDLSKESTSHLALVSVVGTHLLIFQRLDYEYFGSSNSSVVISFNFCLRAQGAFKTS